jgi:hypothetical protein
MGRFLRKLKKRLNKPKIQDQDGAQRAFEDEKPDAMKADIRMISGCEDEQTSVRWMHFVVVCYGVLKKCSLLTKKKPLFLSSTTG